MLHHLNYINTLFVVTEKHIFLIDIARNARYLNTINIKDKGPTVNSRVFIGLDSLLIVYSDNTVDEYDLMNLGSPSINNIISNYHTYDRYNFINPTTAGISSNGLLYILANDTTLNAGKGGIVVMVYRTF